jgi:CelD/BcsL family acetyltransferase involved in cellulose biosynthesis
VTLESPGIADISRDWDHLADLVVAAPFLRPGWFIAWWSAFGTGRLDVLSVRRHGRLVAVAALQRGLGVIRACANEHSPDFAILAEDAEAARELCQAILAQGGRRISMGSLDPTDQSSKVFQSSAASVGWRTLTVIQQRSPYIDLSGDERASHQRYARRVLSDVRRRRRRLEEEGRLKVEIEDGRTRLDELLDEGFAIEGSGWKDRRGTALRSHESTRRHYTSVARWAAGRGTLRLAFLRLEGRAIAFQFALEDARRYYFLKGGYATEYARFAPGKVLVQATLEHAYQAGLLSYELLGAAEPWKLEWTDRVRERILIDAFAPSAAGLLDSVARTVFLRGTSLAKRALVGIR